ncbi:hypothetical protein HYFRA_00003695 [Hymenoscyphus fraxineus]|uniref:NmrA-like domain-containing protein n=1 Tax=Hymenoscyphus fraxineus TaxID=746836 RepID=A0A9N9PUL0_9HELO|nr:hypothetical protein HYFRA_00003695 [Hymenoscyphus fraxineus]
MVEIKNVVHVGAAGSLGAPILKALIDSGKFNVTVLTRENSKSTFPSSVKVVKADYTSLDSVTAAFKGQDAVVSTVGTEGLLGQSLFIDAAIAAGVKRFIPSEFGSNLANPLTAALPIFGYKIATRKHIEAKVAGGADITYTYIQNGPFLDWGLQVNFLVDLRSGSPKIFDGGDQKVSATTLASIGTAVVGVLSHYDETKNRDVFIQDIAISQNRIVEIAKKIKPEKAQEPVHVKTADTKAASDAALAKGDYSEGTMFPYLFTAIFAEGYGNLYTKLDNELVGLKPYTEADVEALVKSILA